MQLNVALLAPIGMIYHDPFDGVQTQTIFFCQQFTNLTWSLVGLLFLIWMHHHLESESISSKMFKVSRASWVSALKVEMAEIVGHPDLGTLEKGWLVTWGYAYLHWWLQPMPIYIGIFSPNWDEHTNYLKPPPSYDWIKKNTSLKTPVNTCEPSIGCIDRFLAPGHRTAASSICWYRPLAIDPSGVGQWKHDDVGICFCSQGIDDFLLCLLKSGFFSTFRPCCRWNRRYSQPVLRVANTTCTQKIVIIH